MSDIIKSKVSKIGNSLWVLIPRDIVMEKKIKPGQEIEFSILNKERVRAVKNTFGIARGSKGFRRLEHLDRDI